MKTKFIQIPAVGRCSARVIDPTNRAHLASLISRAEAYFKLSAKAWEDGNNSGDPKFLAKMTREEIHQARNGERLLNPLGIKCDWPGLYPSFEVNGYHEYTTQSAVLAALGLPRNYLS
jgi:hypothetical protein